MSPDEVVKLIQSRLTVLREDIARAKGYLIRQSEGLAEPQAGKWLAEQAIEEPNQVDTENGDQIDQLIKAYSLRKAFYWALFELVASGEMVLTSPVSKFTPLLTFYHRSAFNSMNYEPQRYEMGFAEPRTFQRISLPDDVATDPDIFLEGIDCNSLHSGIREAVEQSLGCFRRGLYMPATAMLVAAAEGTWSECGTAVATKLNHTKLKDLFLDRYASISRKVSDLRKSLEHPDAKQLLKVAGRTIAGVSDAEVWTTVLRDRRNALHWGKAKCFVADHSETATLILAAPLHIATLEAIRLSC